MGKMWKNECECFSAFWYTISNAWILIYWGKLSSVVATVRSTPLLCVCWLLFKNKYWKPGIHQCFFVSFLGIDVIFVPSVDLLLLSVFLPIEFILFLFDIMKGFSVCCETCCGISARGWCNSQAIYRTSLQIQVLTFHVFKFFIHVYFNLVDVFYDRDREGGYTRLLRTRIRVGDAAPMAYIE